MTPNELEKISRTPGKMIVHPTLGPVYIDQDLELSATYWLRPIYGDGAIEQASKSQLDYLGLEEWHCASSDT